MLMLLAFKGYGLTHEQKIVALTILGEARGEGKAGMYAVACVIQQRALNRTMSAARVCKQRKQFSCWNSKRDLSYLLKSSSAPYAILLAKNLKQLDLKYINWLFSYFSKALLEIEKTLTPNIFISNSLIIFPSYKTIIRSLNLNNSSRSSEINIIAEPLFL